MSGVLTGVGEETGQEVGASRRGRRAAGVCAHRPVCACADGAQGPRKVRGSVQDTGRLRRLPVQDQLPSYGLHSVVQFHPGKSQ